MTILAHHVLEHIHPEEITKVFENIHFMHINGGYLVICVPDLHAPNSRYYSTYKEAIIFQPKASHYIYFSLESLTYLLHNTGYNVNPIYFHNKNGEAKIINIFSDILESIKLRKYIERSISANNYSICIIAQKRN